VFLNGKVKKFPFVSKVSDVSRLVDKLNFLLHWIVFSYFVIPAKRLCRNSPIVTPAKAGAQCRVLSQKYSGCVINIVLIIKYLYFLVLRPVPVVK